MSCLRRWVTTSVVTVLLAAVLAPSSAGAAPGAAGQRGGGGTDEVVELLYPNGDPIELAWQINERGQALASFDDVWDTRTGTATSPPTTGQ